jgi:hypothetical protein
MFRRSNSKELFFLRKETDSKRNAIYLIIYLLIYLNMNMQIVTNFRGAHSRAIG